MTMREVKLCLLGESGVGKSSIVQRFVSDTFSSTLDTTIGASFMTKTVIVENVSYKFQIWDTAGQERYRALAPMYYRGAGAAIVVYDITKESTYESVKNWIDELYKHGPQQIVKAIAGNKCDLKDQREVDANDAAAYSDQVGAIFIETSALTAVNVSQLFIQICKSLPKEDSRRQIFDGSMRVSKEDKLSKKCC